MNNEHTPGPWAYWEPETDNGKWQIDAPSGPMCPRKKIATVHTKVVGSEANARLIAAAPDMLAALQKISGYYPSDDDIAGSVARAAIAEAVSCCADLSGANLNGADITRLEAENH